MKVIMMLLVLLLPSLAQAGDYKFVNEPTGFRDINWGDSQKAITSSEVVEHRAHTSVLISHDDKLVIGNTTLISINYIFYRDSLESIMILASGRANCESFKQVLDLKYGATGLKANPYLEEYIWKGDNVISSFSYNEIINRCDLFISNTTVNKEQRQKDLIKDTNNALGDM